MFWYNTSFALLFVCVISYQDTCCFIMPCGVSGIQCLPCLNFVPHAAYISDITFGPFLDFKAQPFFSIVFHQPIQFRMVHCTGKRKIHMVCGKEFPIKLWVVQKSARKRVLHVKLAVSKEQIHFPEMESSFNSFSRAFHLNVHQTICV